MSGYIRLGQVRSGYFMLCQFLPGEIRLCQVISSHTWLSLGRPV